MKTYMIQEKSVTRWWNKLRAPWFGTLFDEALLRPEDAGEERIQRLRESLVEFRTHGKKGRVSIERAVLFTESYRKTEGEPPVIRRAKAYKEVLERIPIQILPDELIVGIPSSERGGVNVCPEYHAHWLLRNVNVGGKFVSELDAIPSREYCEYYIYEEDMATLKNDVLAYWQDKTHWTFVEKQTRATCPEVLLARELHGVYAHPHEISSLGHLILQYTAVLTKGILGLKEDIDRQISALEASLEADSTAFDRRNYYEAMKICADAIVTYAKRHAEEAEQLAKEEDNGTRRSELNEIARICRKVPAKPADSWWEALQSFWFVHLASHLLEDADSTSPGRFDQYMYAFLAKDLNEGNIEGKRAQELLECLWVKFNERIQLYNYSESITESGFKANHNISIGGVDRYGRDASNLLSHMILEAHAHVHMTEPQFSVRMHKGTPKAFLIKILELLRLGGGLPQLINDDVIIPSLLSRGLDLNEARNYASIGCEENASDPNITTDTWGRTNGGWYNLVKPIELVLFNGVNPVNGKLVGPQTGDPATFTSMRDFLNALRTQDEYFTKLLTVENNILDYVCGRYSPTPYAGLMLPGPREKGMDPSEGGCRFNWTGPLAVGLGTAGDTLAAIDYLVFKKKTVSMNTLVQAISKDWDRLEVLRQQCLNAPKYGNDDEYADSFFRKRAEIFIDAVEKNHCGRNHGPFFAGFVSQASYIAFGGMTGATPDGRRKFEKLSDGISPRAGADRLGPIASHKSAAKLDTLRITNGLIFNQKFGVNTVSTPSDLEKWSALVMTYFSLGGLHVQYNVVDRETLIEAQKHPEEYRGLVVRVAGYSAFFVELAKDVQDSIIERIEHQL